MKRFISTALMVGFLATAAVAADTVYSVNVAGFSRVSVPPSNGLVLAGMSLRPFDATFLGVFGTNQLRSAALYNSADRIKLWDTASQTYLTYAQKPDGTFHPATNLTEWLTGPAVNPVLTNGMAFWIQSPGSSTTTNVLTFMGEAVDSPALTANIVTGLQMRAYPFSSAINIQNTHFAQDGATSNALYNNADWIQVWEGRAYVRYALKNDGKWHKATNLTEWLTGPAASNAFDVSQGFWYTAKKAFVWSETNCYLGNLRN